MKVPISWLKDFVNVDMPLLDLANLLTNCGLEVERITLVGLPATGENTNSGERQEFQPEGLAWDPEKIVVAQIDEVMPHPNADRLVLCRLNDGLKEHTVLTGAPNLFEYKGKGPLSQPLKVAYAKEGARIYDGHQPGQVLTTLKRAKIRGVESYSMVCSEKELGISEEHEGILVLDADAPTGAPLVDYMGDAVFEVAILPNMIRDACILGVAREISALTGQALRQPQRIFQFPGPSVEGKASIEIRDPELNPRFVVGLICGVEISPSPSWVQRRLRLAGMRPINNIVDATNYAMLEIGEPLHAFDYDVLVQRAGGMPPTIITRTAEPGERLTTLDGEEHILDPFTVLVCDTAGALSIAGVMGGQESEVSAKTRNVLLEGAAWNYINIRRTLAAQRMLSEAAYRFSRGIHPAMAPWGVQLCLEHMRQWSGGQVASGLIDAYSQPYSDPVVTLDEDDVARVLGVRIPAAEIAGMLDRLGFTCRVEGTTLSAQAPDTRMDIGEGLTGKADVIEEIARMVGYHTIPETNLADVLPMQRRNPALEKIERTRDILAGLGLQEVINYRLTSPEREARLLPSNNPAEMGEYLRLKNPIAPDRAVMRRSLLASVMEVVERNARFRDRLALFEIGPVFLPELGEILPAEPQRLAIVLFGKSRLPAWDRDAGLVIDFYDLKGLAEALLNELHIPTVSFIRGKHPSMHPGKCAEVIVAGRSLGSIGELHPQVKDHYDLGEAPALVADLDLEVIVALSPDVFDVGSVSTFPPVLEDIAVIVDEQLPAAQVDAAIREAGGKMLVGVRLFDIFQGEQIGAGKKSLAYSLIYQAPDRTLTDGEAAKIRQRIIQRLEQELGAKLRS
ncbi:MAG: phenylalanine--tRNA ligase subunit beta [Anaerolineaceae bacterium]|nr:phenylalanine--tRNA ligase subunit beta [Anaerolineaceae bacterium]